MEGPEVVETQNVIIIYQLIEAVVNDIAFPHRQKNHVVRRLLAANNETLPLYSITMSLVALCEYGSFT